MDLAQAVVLITGSTSGIGLALAERFMAAGSKVIICGRRKDRLEQIKADHPGCETLVCDVATAEERKRLFEQSINSFPNLNVVVNNAGIQRRVQLPEAEPWAETQSEIAINLEAPIHLTQLFIPHLLEQINPVIINVTSGLAFCPKADVPVYCATKAALHNFTLSMRHQLSQTNPPIKVVEIIPPAVNTDLGGVGLHTFGVPLDDFADSVFKRLTAGEEEVPYGLSERLSRASRADLDAAFKNLNPASKEHAEQFLKEQSGVGSK